MMSVIDAEEFARRRKQKKTDKEEIEDYIYQEKIADLVEKILTDTAYTLKRKDIELDHFLIELWVQSNFIALKLFQDKAYLNKNIDKREFEELKQSICGVFNIHPYRLKAITDDDLEVVYNKLISLPEEAKKRIEYEIK